MSNPPQWTALPPRLLPGSPSLLFIPISSFSPFYFPILQSSDTVPPCFPLIRPWCADCTNARYSIPEQDSCVHTKPPPLRRPSPRPPGSFPPPGSPFLPSLLLRCTPRIPAASWPPPPDTLLYPLCVNTALWYERAHGRRSLCLHSRRGLEARRRF